MQIIENFDSVKNNVFNVGFNKENYQKIKVVEIIKKFIPELHFTLVEKGSDLRDYQVDFSKLPRYLNVKKTYTVEDGVKQIVDMLRSGIIKNCSDPKYYNTYPHIGDSIPDRQTVTSGNEE